MSESNTHSNLNNMHNALYVMNKTWELLLTQGHYKQAEPHVH